MNTAQPSFFKDKRTYLHSAIGLLIMLGFGFLPPVAPITALGMRVLGIFIGACYLWSTVGMLWPSIACIIGIALSGYSSMTDALKLTFGAEAVWMSVFAMAIMAAIAQAGVNDYLIAKILGSKIINGRPWVFTMVFFVAVSFFCSCINSTIGYFLFWAILADFAVKFDLKRGEKYIVLMLIGVGMIGHMAANILPFRNFPMVMLYSIKGMTGVEINYFKYMCISIPLQLVFILAYTAMMRWLFRCDVSKIANISAASFAQDRVPLNKKQKFLLGYLVFFILALVVPTAFPKTSFIGTTYSTLGSVGIMLILFMVLCVIRLDGQAILDFQKLSGNIYWEMPFLLAAAMGISTVLVDEATGVKAFLMQLLVPIFQGYSPVAFLVVMGVIAIILTNLCNNLVVAFMFMPIVVSYSAEVAINLPAAITILIYAVLISFLLPASSATAGMLMANPLIEPKAWFKLIIPLIILMSLVLLLVGLPLCLLIY